MTDYAATRLRLIDAIGLLLITAGAAVLRLYQLGWSSLWLDEILNVDITRRLGDLPWWRWIAGFEPENGPLYFALQALALEVSGPIEYVWRLPAAIVGIATVPAVFLATRLVVRSRVAAHCAAFLVAVSPFHVFYSREGRTYSLLLLETVMVVIALALPMTRRSLALLAIALVAAAYTAATAAPLIGSVIVVGIVRVVRDRDRRALAVVAAGGVCLLLVALLYLGHDRTPSMATFNSDAARIARDTLVMFTSSTQPTRTVPRISAALALFALLGAVVMARRDRRAFDLTITLPLSIGVSTLAALMITNHWFSVRYLTPLFAIFVVNAAAGLWIAAEAIARTFSRSAGARGGLATAVIGFTLGAIGEDQAILALREPYERPDWRGAARLIAQHSKPGDVVLAANPWSHVSLGFYLRELNAPIKVRGLLENRAAAQDGLNDGSVAWFAAGGVYDDEQIRWWLCGRLHLAYADEAEDLRIYAARGEPDLVTRLRSDDVRRLAGREALTADLAAGSRSIGEGWFLPELEGGATFRWAGKSASIRLPALPNEAYLRFRAMGVDASQSVAIDVDGAPLGDDIALNGEWRDYVIALPPNANRMSDVTFRFSHTVSPVSAGINDRRELAAAFESICVVSDRTTACRPHAAALPLRLDTGVPRRPPLPVWRSAEGEPDGEAIHALIARLGLEPELSAPVVTRQDDLQRIVRVGMLALECADETDFVQTAVLRVLERRLDAPGLEHARATIRRGGRRLFLDELMRTREFRRKYFQTEGERSEASIQR